MGIISQAYNDMIDFYRVKQTGDVSTDFDESGDPVGIGGDASHPYESVALNVPCRIQGLTRRQSYVMESALIESGRDKITDICFMDPLVSPKTVEIGYVGVSQNTGKAYFVRIANKAPGGSTGHHWEIGLDETAMVS